MKVLIDTNVLISAALRDRTPEEIIQFVTSQANYTWIVSNDILVEYRSVLRRPRFALPDFILARWDAMLDAFTTPVDVSTSVDFPRDQGDAKFLACALTSEADFLITGDRDFEVARKLVTTTILSVSTFKRLVIDSS
jgi:putative PIN family toxin of toxin-antitoxin system